MMLDHAAIPHEVVPATIDEVAIKQKIGVPLEAAVKLAKAKALQVSSDNPGEWVIGSDSIVAVGGRMFDKPVSRAEAAEHLRFFSGKAMSLTSAVALARDGSIDWVHGETARLEVRALSAEFIDDYLECEWPAVGGCVGIFRMEGPGVQLFDSVEGSHFTILGMPLLALLGALRDREILPS